MPQYLRPTWATQQDAWAVSGDPGNPALHEQIDEVTPSDTDSVWVPHGSEFFPDAQYLKLPLLSADTPARKDGHRLRVRMWQVPDPVGAYTPGATVVLFQGASNLADWSLAPHYDPQTETFELTTLQATAITDYSDLSVWIIRDAGARGIYLSWVEFEVPLAPFAHLDQNDGGLIVAAAGSGNYLTTSGGGILRAAGGETEGALILGSGGGHGVRL